MEPELSYFVPAVGVALWEPLSSEGCFRSCPISLSVSSVSHTRFTTTCLGNLDSRFPWVPKLLQPTSHPYPLPPSFSGPSACLWPPPTAVLKSLALEAVSPRPLLWGIWHWWCPPGCFLTSPSSPTSLILSQQLFLPIEGAKAQSEGFQCSMQVY